MGGRSSTSQAVSSTDNRRVIGQNGISNEGGSVVVSNYSLDGDVANAAFGVGNNALGLGAHAIDANGRVVTSALNFGSDALAGALDSADRSGARATNFATDAMAGAYGFTSGAVTQALNFATDALGSNQSAFERSLNYSQQTTAAALANLQATQNLTKDAYADAKGRGALTDKMMIGAIIAMAVVALMAVEK